MVFAQLNVEMASQKALNNVMTEIQMILMDVHRYVKFKDVTKLVSAKDGFCHV